MMIRKECSPNYDHNCYGGGIFTHGSNLSFTGSTRFLGNSARNGGGIYAGNSNVSVSGTFIRNSAYDGGGIFAWSYSNVNINGDTTFIDNLANVQGAWGSIY